MRSGIRSPATGGRTASGRPLGPMTDAEDPEKVEPPPGSGLPPRARSSRWASAIYSLIKATLSILM